MDFILDSKGVIAIIAGFVLDSILGDPQNPLHPIRLIGKVVNLFIYVYQKAKPKESKMQFICGAVTTIFVVTLTYVCVSVIIKYICQVNIFVAVVVESIFCYFIIAPKSLYDESEKIYKLICKKDLIGARKQLSFIVGRDTENLSEEKVIKATVETVSENLTDGVIAPLLFMFIGGAPLGMAYKAVNTLDSMIGYRNENFEYFGKFAAKLDDVVNFVPARLSAILMILASLVYRKDFKGAFAVYCSDKNKHLSPNSAHTEAVCAGALGIELGGESTYKGKLTKKPTIGHNKRRAVAKDIKDSAVLMYLATVFALLIGICIIVLLNGGYHV